MIRRLNDSKIRNDIIHNKLRQFAISCWYRSHGTVLFTWSLPLITSLVQAESRPGGYGCAHSSSLAAEVIASQMGTL
jgi:hypothetical protein